MDKYIDGLDIWDEHGHRVICKGLEMIEKNFHVVERRS